MLKVVGSLFAVLAWVALIGLQRIWRYTFGWLFNTLAGLLDAVRIPIPHFHDPHPFGHVASWLRSLDRNVSSELALRANQAEHLAVWLFSRFRYVFTRIGEEIERLAADVLAFGLRVVRVYIPRLVKSLLRFVWRELRKLGHYARRMIPKLWRKLFSFAKWATRAIARGVKHLGFLWKWAKAVLRFHWRIIKGIQKRLRGLEHLLVPKKFRGLVYAALGGLGLLWLLTDNVIQVGKWIGTLDKGAIWEWVKDEVQMAPQRNICELNALAYDVALYVVEPVIRKEIAVLTWICQPDENDLPYGCEFPTPYKGAWEPYGTPVENEAMQEKRLAPGLPLPAGVIQA